MTRLKPPLCIACIHIRPPQDNLMSCKAYAIIPSAIASNRLDHRLPIVNDNGIQFEQDPDQPALDMEAYDAIFRPVVAGDD